EIAWFAVAPKFVGDFAGIRRKKRIVLEFIVLGELAQLAILDVHGPNCALVSVADARSGAARKNNPAAVARPGKWRRPANIRRRFGKAPSAGGQATIAGAIGFCDPDMLRARGSRGEESIVAHFKGVFVLIERLLVRRIGRSVGDARAVRTPRELLDALRRVSDFARFAAGHRKQE